MNSIDVVPDDIAPVGAQSTLAQALEIARVTAGLIWELRLADGIYRADSLSAGLRSIDSTFTGSELRVVSATGNAVLIGPQRRNRRALASVNGTADSSFFTVANGAPPVSLNGLIFNGSESGPAVSAEGGQLDVDGCRFVGNPASALRVLSGAVRIRGSVFNANGAHTHPEGGAIQALGGDVDITHSTFEANIAQRGGALFASSTRRCWIRQTTFARNNASAEGGAIFVRGSTITLSDQTLLESNTAEGSGQSTFIDASAVITYALPAPNGYWIPNTIRCSGQLCDAQYAGYTIAILTQSLEDRVLPFQCAPGLVGSSETEADQTSSQCGGPCPRGFCGF